MAPVLLSDRFVDFLLFDVLDAPSLGKLPAYASCSAETIALVLDSARKLSREVLAPTYRPMDHEPPRFESGRVRVHPLMHELLPRMRELDLSKASRPESRGGMGLPSTVSMLASTYIAAANLSALGFFMLTAGASNLIDTFGSDALKKTYSPKMHACEWMGTMALTEPHAGSSLSDVTTAAIPLENGVFSIKGSKIFISGGDQDLTENVVHLLLARIEGAAPGTKGISLFVVPKMRPRADGTLEPNDVHTTQVLHKVGWRGLPSVALSFGDEGDCRGYLVGQPHQGLRYMFQMMNEARILVGLQAASTASAAYQESLEYARTRPQGRAPTSRDPRSPQVAIIEHADVRRMLLRQKAIVEGSLALLGRTARYADLAENDETPEKRAHAALLLDVLTPIAKTFPAERGFESCALAVQIHGGYGYTTDYVVESFMRDQKLNTIHEGTSGIQSLDLLGRKVMASQGGALRSLAGEIEETVRLARAGGVEAAWCDALSRTLARVGEVTMALGMLGMNGDVSGMLRHSADYLEAMGIACVAWQWLDMARAAKNKLDRASGESRAFYEGELRAAQYWFSTELPKATTLLDLCASGDDSYDALSPASL